VCVFSFLVLLDCSVDRFLFTVCVGRERLDALKLKKAGQDSAVTPERSEPELSRLRALAIPSDTSRLNEQKNDKSPRFKRKLVKGMRLF